jgi:hypothetical protein
MPINSILSFAPGSKDTLAQAGDVRISLDTHSENSAEHLDTVQKNAPAAVTTFSKEGLALLAKQQPSDPIDAFLAEHGQALYDVTIKRLKTYPDNLATKLEDKSLPQAERTEAQNTLTERELNAFAKYARQSPPDMKKYLEKYVEYLDSLSPEELQSNRYKGQRALAVTAYQQVAREDGGEVKDLSFPQDPILALFEAIRQQDFNIKDSTGFRDRYEAQVSPLFDGGFYGGVDGDSGLGFRTDADQVLRRFDAMQSVIEAARSGDQTALGQLQQLSNDPPTIDRFITYANSLT